MQLVTNHRYALRGFLSVLVVLVTVCSLTISVATRYSSYGSSGGTGRTVHRHSSPDTNRPRLSKNSATWIPPFVSSNALQEPSSYPCIAPAGPPVTSLVFETSLYNRP